MLPSSHLSHITYRMLLFGQPLLLNVFLKQAKPLKGVLEHPPRAVVNRLDFAGSQVHVQG